MVSCNGYHIGYLKNLPDVLQRRFYQLHNLIKDHDTSPHQCNDENRSPVRQVSSFDVGCSGFVESTIDIIRSGCHVSRSTGYDFNQCRDRNLLRRDRQYQNEEKKDRQESNQPVLETELVPSGESERERLVNGSHKNTSDTCS